MIAIVVTTTATATVTVTVTAAVRQRQRFARRTFAPVQPLSMTLSLAFILAPALALVLALVFGREGVIDALDQLLLHAVVLVQGVLLAKGQRARDRQRHDKTR